MVVTRLPARRRGMSLIEVLAGLAIFLFSIVVITQMVEQGSRAGLRAQQLTKAAMLAEARLSELSAGVVPMESSGPESIPLGNDQGWQLTVTCNPENWAEAVLPGESLIGLWGVEVLVRWVNPYGGVELEYVLSRVMLDPRLKQPDTTTPTTTTGGSGVGGGP
ncbi:MAG TPA: prepilin-type N-terminal cleavage/methylation domain-containing protein [Gemmatales bacterium]|nr:prepilin-type N-terminal cleavage/methylation domain-containing protein [Gemmatales bacterium]